MATFGNFDMFGDLNVKGNLYVRNNIIQDDILYPTYTITGNNTSTVTITISVSKKDNVKTQSERTVNFRTNNMPASRMTLMPARPIIKWWHCEEPLSSPTTLSNTSLSVTEGIMINPLNGATNSDIIRTTLTSQNHLVKLTITRTSKGSTIGYTSFSIQGIIYATTQWTAKS